MCVCVFQTFWGSVFHNNHQDTCHVHQSYQIFPLPNKPKKSWRPTPDRRSDHWLHEHGAPEVTRNWPPAKWEQKQSCATWVVYFLSTEKNSNSHPLVLHKNINYYDIALFSVLSFSDLLRVVVLFLLLLLATSHGTHSFIVQPTKASALWPRFAALSGSVWATDFHRWKTRRLNGAKRMDDWYLTYHVHISYSYQ